MLLLPVPQPITRKIINTANGRADHPHSGLGQRRLPQVNLTKGGLSEVDPTGVEGLDLTSSTLRMATKPPVAAGGAASFRAAAPRGGAEDWLLQCARQHEKGDHHVIGNEIAGLPRIVPSALRPRRRSSRPAASASAPWPQASPGLRGYSATWPVHHRQRPTPAVPRYHLARPADRPELRTALQTWLEQRPTWPSAQASPALLLNRRGGRLFDRSA